MIPTRTTQSALAQRRFLAVQRVADGVPASQVAAVLGVHVETVRLWVRTHAAGAMMPCGEPRTPVARRS